MSKKLFAILLGNLLAVMLLLTSASGLEKEQEWRKYADKPLNLQLSSGETERCLTCHQGIEEISPTHPVEVLGCVVCHGGNGRALDQETAHQGLLGGRNPSTLSTAAKACGAEDNLCHAGRGTAYLSPVDTVPLVPMSTKAGEISEVGRTLGWQEGDSKYAVEQVSESANAIPPDLAEIRAIEGPEPVLEKYSAPPGDLGQLLTDNCLANCHLNTGTGQASRGEGQDSQEENHLAGCAACHVPYQRGGTYQGNDLTINKYEPGHAPFHQMTTAITYNQCNSCHNQGVHSISKMTFYPREDVPSTVVTSPRADREQVYYIPQARYAACEVDLDCIDCHTRNEVMGDGHLYGNKAKAQVIRCYNCHGTTEASPAWHRVEADEDPALWASNYFHDNFTPLEIGDFVAVTDRGEPMVNVRLEDKQVILYSKIDGRRLVVPQVKGSGCLQEIDRQQVDDCHQCHDVSQKD